MQTRTLRDEHVDQHWVNSMNKGYFEWCIELNNKLGNEPDGVQFLGQDDKAKIPIGNRVAVSTNVRPNTKAISSSKPDSCPKAADHDWSTASIVPSVTLICNKPKCVGGSFFGGGENGCGEIFVTLKDATFQPSHVFDHSAQLIDVLSTKHLKPMVLIQQSDGGGDHNITFIKTQLAMIALFLVMDFDHLVVLRGAPHGSFLNKVERSMSLLNLGLQHVALVRKQMEPWAETVLSSASSMAEVRKMVAEWERYKDAEMTRLGARLAEILDANDLSDALSAADDDNENDVVIQAMNEVNRTLSTQGTMSVLMYLTIIFHC
jgi:hypothetical protein